MNEEEINCPLCSTSFRRDAAAEVCSSCPLGHDCSMVCCPECGYKFTVESSLVNFFKKFRSDKNDKSKE